ncbi:MAG TPA: ATPase, T2SS/T4P/T4SS family, partial [Tepidisphaeraceae bacterium]|nr:ATPase, T2SS/T4P/T4SS family [Tepidisphaeraceae bacterium]
MTRTLETVDSPKIADKSDSAAHALRELRQTICQRLAVDLCRDGELPKDEITRNEVKRRIEEFLNSARPNLDEAARDAVRLDAMNELFGLGPLQSLLDDPSVTEIMVNRADRVYAERNGRSARTDVVFDDDAHVRRTIEKIVQPLGRRIDEDCPLVDARLPDGSRVNAAIQPVAIDGCNLTIRKFPTSRMTMEDLVRCGSVTAPIGEFLKACVVSRLNIVVAGGTGSGKTTLLNILSSYIPDHERIVTIEDAAELQLGQDQVVRLESKKPHPDGTGGVTIRELVRNALRMRPDRIVVGECRGGETLDML